MRQVPEPRMLTNRRGWWRGTFEIGHRCALPGSIGPEFDLDWRPTGQVSPPAIANRPERQFSSRTQHRVSGVSRLAPDQSVRGQRLWGNAAAIRRGSDQWLRTEGWCPQRAPESRLVPRLTTVPRDANRVTVPARRAPPARPGRRPSGREPERRARHVVPTIRDEIELDGSPPCSPPIRL